MRECPKTYYWTTLQKIFFFSNGEKLKMELLLEFFIIKKKIGIKG